MKKILFLLIILFFTSCRTIEYIEVPKVEKEFKTLKDSVYLKDSIFFYQYSIGDSFFLEKEVFKYIFKTKIDSVFVVDSIPYPVEKVKKVNELTPFQHKEIVGFWILLAIILVFIVLKIKRRG